MDVTCLDLSPYYLANARDNLKYWRRVRAPASQKDTTDKFIQVVVAERLHDGLPCRLQCTGCCCWLLWRP